jgi:glucosamine--fructose-6-phosphate aminotransferase (isomerizing)
MLDEIREQPAALSRTLAAGVRRSEAIARRFEGRRPRLIVLAARGTSDNAALFGRYLLEIATAIPVSLSAPSIYTLYGAKVDLREALAIGISQSGESTDTNLVLERAREQGALTIGITNESSSAMARIADEVFLVRAGKEKSVAATKTYTGQMLALYLIALALGAAIRADDLKRLADWTESALKLESEIGGLCERYRFMEHAVVVGRGLNYANAFEFALKLMETCYVVAERFSSADFLHGPIALVEASFPVFLFAPPDVTAKPVRALHDKLRALGAETVAITGPASGIAATRSIRVPARIPELYTPIPYIVPAQLFAALLAGSKGLNPDRPRTLSKVTRTL